MIELRNVSVTFTSKQRRDVEAVKQASISINTGEIFGIVGTSGAGKSTLVRTINLLERPTSGRVIIGKVDITDFKGKSLRDIRLKIGMIFQHFNLIHTKSVASNIRFAMKAAGKPDNEIEQRIPELLSLVGLLEKAHTSPAKLSGGQKQRVAIARALANQPDILLCDEPTSALDLDTTKSILELLKDINRRFGITIVIITHEMDVVKSICDRVAVMGEGEIVESGTVYDVFANPNHNLTKQLVRHSLTLELPDRLIAEFKGIIFKIIYRGSQAESPILSEAVALFNLKLNILHGKIEYIGGKPLGLLIIGVAAPADTIAALFKYLQESTYSVEVLHESD
ncbi:MAG TPA: methionine ABC transporter ATP-binding protein [Firmicutes bacterium]|jgi:D-methionine transport system ATP-binding protein|nr:methionine ABC transporter ATP-binding protein [Bacillota bacterium]